MKDPRYDPDNPENKARKITFDRDEFLEASGRDPSRPITPDEARAASQPQPYDKIVPKEQTEHVHVWDILDVWRPATSNYHPRLPQSQITVVLVRCRTCDLPQTVELDGVWTIEQITKSHARIEHRSGH